MNVTNPEFGAYENEPIEIAFRNLCGISIDPAEAEHIAEHAAEFLSHSDDYRQTIERFMKDNVYNIGRSGQNGAKCIVSRLI